MDRATAALTGLPVEALPADKPVNVATGVPRCTCGFDSEGPHFCGEGEPSPFTEAQIRQHRINDYANDAIARDKVDRAEGRY